MSQTGSRDVAVVLSGGGINGVLLELGFLKRLRGEKRFESVDALIDQMALDVEAARAICARHA